MAPGDSNYDGSHVLAPLAAHVGLPVDQMNFVTSQLLGLGLGFLLHHRLSLGVVSSSVRHLYSIVIGLLMAYFCYGNQSVHLLVLICITYLILHITDSRTAPYLILPVSIGYLLWIHYNRLMQTFLHSLDVTGPMMVLTQRVTSLAFSLHDAQLPSTQLTDMQKQLVVSTKPGLLQYLSYNLHFQTLLTGPCVQYCHYLQFMENTTGKHSPPSPTLVVLRKVCLACVIGLLMVLVAPTYPVYKNGDREFIESTTISYRIFYVLVSTSLMRAKYYFAWTMADAVCNASGFGYGSPHPDLPPSWDLLTNIDIFTFETALSFRDALLSWNKATMMWLRYVVYDRCRHVRYRLVLTYALSAVWHGLFPGYYITFCTGAIFTMSSRLVRRKVRPIFHKSGVTRVLYHVVTFVFTRLAIAYVACTFVLLYYDPSINYLRSMYFSMHILAIASCAILPLLPSPPRTDKALNNNLYANMNGNNNRLKGAG